MRICGLFITTCKHHDKEKWGWEANCDLQEMGKKC